MCGTRVPVSEGRRGAQSSPPDATPNPLLPTRCPGSEGTPTPHALSVGAAPKEGSLRRTCEQRQGSRRVPATPSAPPHTHR